MQESQEMYETQLWMSCLLMNSMFSDECYFITPYTVQYTWSLERLDKLEFA